MKLYCARHGEANPADVDAQRGLSPKGVEGVTCVAQAMQQAKVDIAHVLSSNKTRAAQTAAIFADHLNCNPVVMQTELSDEQADLSSILDMLQAYSENTLLVGHLPFMPLLVNALLLKDTVQPPLINFCPGTVVCLQNTAPSEWMINWVLTPKLFLS